MIASLASRFANLASLFVRRQGQYALNLVLNKNACQHMPLSARRKWKDHVLHLAHRHVHLEWKDHALRHAHLHALRHVQNHVLRHAHHHVQHHVLRHVCLHVLHHVRLHVQNHVLRHVHPSAMHATIIARLSVQLL
jgi:hypothetical protein